MSPTPTRCPKRAELEKAFLESSVKMADRLNQQLIAVAQGDLDFSKHDGWIEEARLERFAARDALLQHAKEHKCNF